MAKNNIMQKLNESDILSGRRNFLKNGTLFITAGIAGSSFLNSCTPVKKIAPENEISPTEDLMREHGLLNRILLIYQDIYGKLLNNEEYDPALLDNSAGIIRNFVEEYHEKLEEDHLFPRFEKAHLLVDLVNVLRQQHEAGRQITAHILQFGKSARMDEADDRHKLASLIEAFIRMYRPHEAREDTVLFPALHTIVGDEEYAEMGERFESMEHKLFGQDGFKSMVDKVAGIEKKLGIYELSQFTPQF
jgi:hemerythrin-like domain-containing protein